MSEEQKQSSKLLELKSFNACKNAITSMIMMLSHSELDIEISDTGMGAMDSNNCKGMLRNDRDINSMLAMMQEEARFSCKDGQKFIDPFTQSISGLCWVSQLYPRTKEQEKFSRVI